MATLTCFRGSAQLSWAATLVQTSRCQEFMSISQVLAILEPGTLPVHRKRNWRIAAEKNLPPRQGRGYNAKKAAAAGVRKRMSNRELDLEGWVQVALTDDLIEGKNKAIIHDNTGYVLVKRSTLVYTIKANCSSCQFPVIDGKVEVVGEGDDLTIECPLCHTKFSLIDGAVKDYCPKDGPLQWIVGTLKSKADPVAASVYPTRVSLSGRVYAKFVGP